MFKEKISGVINHMNFYFLYEEEYAGFLHAKKKIYSASWDIMQMFILLCSEEKYIYDNELVVNNIH